MSKPQKYSIDDWTICILAGGQSRRMGRDKSRIRIDGQSLLQRVKSVAASVGCETMTLRKDAIPNCGPLSGIYTGLLRAKSRWCLFLGCDMPLVSPPTIKEVMNTSVENSRPVFIHSGQGFGFPLSVTTDNLEQLEKMVNSGKRSLFQLAERLHPIRLQISKSRLHELFNANTPEELYQLRQLIKTDVA